MLRTSMLCALSALATAVLLVSTSAASDRRAGKSPVVTIPALGDVILLSAIGVRCDYNRDYGQAMLTCARTKGGPAVHLMQHEIRVSSFGKTGFVTYYKAYWR